MIAYVRGCTDCVITSESYIIVVDVNSESIKTVTIYKTER